MKKRHYLSLDEEEIVEDLCKVNKSRSFYRVIDELAHRAEASLNSEIFSLSGADLVYYVIYCIDCLRDISTDDELDIDDEMTHYAKTLWDYWVSHFASNRDYSESDNKAAATLIICTLENCLAIAHVWHDVRDCLISTGRKNNGEYREKVENIIEDILYKKDNCINLRIWMNEYLEGEKMLSDDIAAAIEKHRKANNMEGLGFDEELITKLKPYFGEDEAQTTEFIRNIYGKSDTEIVEHIATLVSKRKIKKRSKKGLHKILHDAKLYKAVHSNFSEQLKILGW